MKASIVHLKVGKTEPRPSSRAATLKPSRDRKEAESLFSTPESLFSTPDSLFSTPVSAFPTLGFRLLLLLATSSNPLASYVSYFWLFSLSSYSCLLSPGFQI
jgi:hypothetical protein